MVTHVCSSLPLYGKGLGWVTPAVFGMVLGFIFKVVKEKSTCPKFAQNTDVK